MAQVRVEHDRLTRYSAIGMIVVGILGILFLGFLGLVITAVGVVMWWYYRRQTQQAARRTAPAGAAGS